MPTPDAQAPDIKTVTATAPAPSVTAVPSAPTTKVTAVAKTPSPIEILDTKAVLDEAKTVTGSHDALTRKAPPKRISGVQPPSMQKNVWGGVMVRNHFYQNRKREQTVYQDFADSKLFPLPLTTSPILIAETMRTAIKTTSEQLKKYNDSGATFTAVTISCHLGNANQKYFVATAANLGDSGASVVSKDSLPQVLTLDYNSANDYQLFRLVKSGYQNNLIMGEGSYQIHLYNGHNLHLLAEPPANSDFPSYRGSLIFFTKERKLYYIDTNGYVPIEIVNADAFDAALAEQTIKHTRECIPLCQTQYKNVNFWRRCDNANASYQHMRLADARLKKLLQHTTKPPALLNLSDSEFCLGLGMTHMLGNSCLQSYGASDIPAITQAIIDADARVILYSDGVSEVLTQSDMAALARMDDVSIAREAFARGSIDDITVLKAIFGQLPLGHALLLALGDGNGVLGHKVATDAVNNYFTNFELQLKPAAVNGVNSAAADQKLAQPLVYPSPVSNGATVVGATATMQPTATAPDDSASIKLTL